MSGLTKGKHIVAEVEGVRCTVVEAGVDEGRMKFLKELLEANRYEVKTAAERKEDPLLPLTYIVAVTDLVFNPVIAIYTRKLFLPDGRIVTPAYWNQQTDQIDPRYWRFRSRRYQSEANAIK